MLQNFADNTDVFASAKDLKSLEHLMNSELARVKKGVILTSCQSVCMGKTNFMIIKFVKKRDTEISPGKRHMCGNYCPWLSKRICDFGYSWSS